MSWVKRTLKKLLFLVLIVVVLVGSVYGISWALAQPIAEHKFFNRRIGENMPLIVAHQGGEAIRPTNTMIAFVDSVQFGTDILDSDMHMTSDGILVLAHDETVDRTSNGTGAIRDMTIAELRKLDFAHNFSPDDGKTYPYRGKGHGIVTVRELFSKFDDVRFAIEIKQTTPEAATKFCSIINEFGYHNQVLVSSFAQENMDVFRTACPSVATSATESEVREFFIYQMIGLVGLYRPKFEALQVPEYSDDRHILNDEFVTNAHKRNLKLIPWTINKVEDFERMIEDIDADGINTNYPNRLAKFIKDQRKLSGQDQSRTP